MTHIDDDLYARIVRQMPIPCVDLYVLDDEDHLLMVKRRNEPAAGEWWFPGGRVLFGETRQEAAERKLKEECGLVGKFRSFVGTFDAILLVPDNGISHAITTVVFLRVSSRQTVVLDEQSSDYRWAPVDEWRHHHQWSSSDLGWLAKSIIDLALAGESV